MTRRFEGLTVLLTGASGGLGREAAHRFAREGARLVLGDRDEAGLAALADSLRAEEHAVEAVAGDIAREENAAALVERALQAFGRLDIAVNNAGIVHPFKKLADLDGATMERMLSVNVMGVFHGLRAQIPAMERIFAETGRTGAILNVASVAGLTGAPLLSAYSAAKHAVVGLTRSAAAETARRGVRINAICPAFTRTAMVTGSLHEMRGTADEAVDRIVQALPMRRLGEPAEIAEAMLWLCSPANSFMTGQAVAVDGGLSAV
ncbi:MAG TPA: SDR family oxidoreductase [Microvirga sp.]|jgi:NAD(P)-dependent dehydrogenase (short-subunit alcohol dehydrogenase family)|nr:SDR family oxidoreductase [Microvirga sp.]